jgi:hypothetical protein
MLDGFVDHRIVIAHGIVYTTGGQAGQSKMPNPKKRILKMFQVL